MGCWGGCECGSGEFTAKTTKLVVSTNFFADIGFGLVLVAIYLPPPETEAAPRRSILNGTRLCDGANG